MPCPPPLPSAPPTIPVSFQAIFVRNACVHILISVVAQYTNERVYLSVHDDFFIKGIHRFTQQR